VTVDAVAPVSQHDANLTSVTPLSPVSGTQAHSEAILTNASYSMAAASYNDNY
jgi:hypothetical protein